MDADRMLRVTDIVGGRRYCFVIMPYASLGLLYQHVRDVIEQTTGLRCIRADEVPGAGQLGELRHHVRRTPQPDRRFARHVALPAFVLDLPGETLRVRDTVVTAETAAA